MRLLAPYTIDARPPQRGKVKKSGRSKIGDFDGRRRATGTTGALVAVLGEAMTTVRYATALPILAAHGLVPGPDGFDPADLVAFAEGWGWTAHAEDMPSRRGLHRCRATVYAHIAGLTVSGTSGHGATEAEALAVALASMLRRER